MNPTGPLLAATDLSEHAQHAAERAARLAHALHRPLSLLHVTPVSALADLRRWLGADDPTEQRLQAQTESQLASSAARLHRAHAVPVQTTHAVGPVCDEILRHAQAIDAALLVLGARGSSGLRRLLLGTTAQRLLRHATRPLLVVRSDPELAYRRVLVAVDFSPSSLRAIVLARWLAPQARPWLLHAYRVPFEDRLQLAGVDLATIDVYRRQAEASAAQQLRSLALQAGLAPGAWQPCLVQGDAAVHILEKASEQACDLIVTGQRGHDQAPRLLLGSVTQHVLAESPVDVLVAAGLGN
jgi:nucleotide-binding universal stress UspA family protein